MGMYIYTHTYTYMCVYVCIYIYICVCVCVLVYVFVLTFDPEEKHPEAANQRFEKPRLTFQQSCMNL